jgi:alkylation response protein AidB-like acyl-CoA dehydrogenase
VDFTLSEEQELLRKSAAEFLAKQAPVERSIPHIDGDGAGWDPAIWHEIAALGWLDDELDLLDQAVLVEECGAVLLPAPLFSTFVAMSAGIESPLRQQGTAREGGLTLAWAEKGRGFGLTDALSAGATVVTNSTITGGKTLVTDAAKVSGFVVVAHDHDGPQLVYVDASDVRVCPHSTLDWSRPLADIELAAASALPLIPSADVVDVVASMEHRAYALAAAEALGVGRSALDLGLTQARERTQFGKPIGAYQAVSHRLVDAYAELELARSLTYWAVHSLQTVDNNRATACAAAKVAATAAAVHACEATIQITGGLGMTWDHIAHRLYKRAMSLQSYMAGERRLYQDIADAVLPRGA